MSTVWARSRVRADASPFSSSFPNRRPSNNKTNQPPTNRVTQAICRPGSTTQAALATEALATQASLAKPPVEAPPVGTIEALLSATEAPPSGATVKDSSIRAPPVNAPTSFVDLAVQVEHVEAELLAGDQAATKAVDASPAAAGVAVHVNAVEPVTVEETGASFARVCLASETQSVEESVAEMSVPEAVKRAIASFQSTAEFTLSPPRHNESSFIYKWGVRVTQLKDGKEQVGWICLASQYCRDHIEVLRLYSGKASQATKHLKDVHNCISEKYTAEMSRKRTREEELNDLRASLALNPDPKRMRLLVETKRIIMGRLPFRSVESDEFRLISDLCVKEELQRLLSARLITNTIVELYSSTKREIVHLLRDNGVMDGKLVTVMADLWTCKPQHKKYLGVRIYFIGKAWKMRSVILGMRLFNPGFGERDTALDFGLTNANLFGGMSDKGPDVSWMLKCGLGLQWEWCIAHMSNASTKAACGLVNDKSKSKNPGMTSLVERIVKTVRQVRDHEVLGSLFEALCDHEGHTTGKKLLDYRSHRFLGLTRVIRRILDRWNEVVDWYVARDQKARRDGDDPVVFPLENDRVELVQLLSLLEPITVLNKKSQSDDCTQVETLLTLYRLRLKTLHADKPVRDYRSTASNPIHFGVAELTPLATLTRKVLAAAFDKNFFNRYTDRAKMRQCSFVFEVQLFLHPTFKNLEGNLCAVVRAIFAQRDSRIDAGVRLADHVRDTVIGKARSIMLAMSEDELTPTHDPVERVAYSEELVDMFGSIETPALPDDVREGQTEEELQRWRAEPNGLTRLEDGAPESVLRFWGRHAENNNYKFFAQACSHDLRRANFLRPD